MPTTLPPLGVERIVTLQLIRSGWPAWLARAIARLSRSPIAAFLRKDD
jgi:hypothetical protein